jgi:hypothetical protein
MNKEVYRRLDKEEIVTKDHYWYHWQNNTFVLLRSNHSSIGKKAGYLYIYEKVSLDDFRPLNDDEIVNDEHFQVQGDSYGHLRMYRCCNSVGRKADDVRKANDYLPEYKICAKKTQFNFETLNILKDIQL